MRLIVEGFSCPVYLDISMTQQFFEIMIRFFQDSPTSDKNAQEAARQGYLNLPITVTSKIKKFSLQPLTFNRRTLDWSHSTPF